tara:strand:+ start:222 stop:443 length:222 start_codon:yes stop_codon:yes gene_type:complete
MNLAEELSQYGEVKTCKLITENVFNVVITKGFDSSGKTLFEFLKKCTNAFPEHTRMETCITEKGFGMVVLVKP